MRKSAPGSGLSVAQAVLELRTITRPFFGQLSRTLVVFRPCRYLDQKTLPSVLKMHGNTIHQTSAKIP